MRGIKLLIKNSFKSSIKNIYQMLGISALIVLVTLIISVMISTTSSILEPNIKLMQDSNLRQLVLTTSSSNRIVGNTKNSGIISQHGSTSQDVYQQELINYLATEDNDYKNLGLEWTRTESRSFSGIKNNSQDLLIKTVAKFGSNQNEIKAGNLTGSSTVDKLVISDGQNFSTNRQEATHQVILQKNFAEKNNIKIGSIVRFNTDTFSDNYGDQLIVTSDPEIEKNLTSGLNGQHWYEAYQNTQYANASWFEVIGYGTSADFAFPTIDQTTTIPNVNKDLIAYVDPKAFGFDTFVNEQYNDSSVLSYIASDAILYNASDYDKEVYFSLKSSFEHITLSAVDFQQKYKQLAGINTYDNIVFDNGDSNYKYYLRTNMFDSVSKVYIAISAVLLAVVLLIAIVTVVVVTRKYVESVQTQVGTLKALGYKKRHIVNNFIAVPLITSIIGCFVGYLISLGVEYGIIVGFSTYFSVNFGAVHFNFLAFILSICATFVAMVIIASIAAYFDIRNNVLDLLGGSAVKDVNVLANKLRKLNNYRGFNARLQGALMASSFGKIFGIAVAVLLATILLSASVIAPVVMHDNVKMNFAGLDYKNSVEYTQPLWNNPLSFDRTYNPVYDASGQADADGWGYTDEDGNKKVSLTDFAQAPDATSGFHAISPLPYLENDIDIDLPKVVNSILNNNISINFYGYDIPQEANDGMKSPWAKMAWMGWKSLPIEFLQNLDGVSDPSGPLGSTILNTLSSQWPDYTEFNTSLKNDADIDALFADVLTFYKKYSVGLPLSYSIDESDDFDAMITNLKINANVDLTNYANAYSWLTPEQIPGTNYYNFNFTTEEDGEFIDPNNIAVKDNDLSPDEKGNLIVEILKWYYGTTYNKMGTILLNTAYSRAPYFVQQKLKNALLNNSQYSLAFGIAPYNPKTDDIGVMINASFKNKKNIEESLKIYGVNIDNKTVNLGKGKNDLFNNQNDDVIPIIINKTMQIKTGLKVGQIIGDIDYSYEELQDKNGDSTKLDVSSGCSTNCTNVSLKGQSLDENEYIPESGMVYYSNNGKSYVTSSVAGVTPSVVAGSKIGGISSAASTSELESHVNVNNGTIRISNLTSNLKNKFKVVGIQESYGSSQAWISNDNAKHLMKYDETEAYLYDNFFVPQWTSTLMDKTKSGLDEKIDLSNEKFSTLDKLNENIKLKNEYYEQSKIVLKMFNNVYPIFNYKNSLDENSYDIDQELNTIQRYGDYSVIGLNGGIETATDSEGRTLDGFGQGAQELIYPITTARQILEQITGIVNMVIILFMVIAFIVSITILLLTTTIIIKENVQFIATMKILGYTNLYIVYQIIGMYIWPTLLAYVIGFVLSWYGLQGLIGILAVNSSWVLPVLFYAWYPFATLGIVLVIFVITAVAGFSSIIKINPLTALQMNK